MQQTFSKVGIAGIAHVVPDKILTSIAIEESLSEHLSTTVAGRWPSGWFEKLTGIKERRVWESDKQPSDAATQAAELLFARDTIDRSSIDLLINCSICQDYSEPATATIIHDKLGMPTTCFPVDLSNACAGLLSGLLYAATMIELGAAQHILLVTGEVSGPLYGFAADLVGKEPASSLETLESQLASFTLGSAAVAVLVSSLDERADAKPVHSVTTLTHSDAWPLCTGQSQIDHQSMLTDSNAMITRGTALAKETWPQFLDQAGWAPDSISRIFPHQVSRKAARSLEQAMDIPQGISAYSFREFGNTASAAVMLTLSLALESDPDALAGRVALQGLGSGLNALFVGLE